MKKALQLALRAYDEGEIPVGAVLVSNGKVIGQGYNQTQQLNDATAHAEMIAITAGSEHLQSRHLQDCALYVTMEPCMMCGGAIYWSQLQQIVFGAFDQKHGFQSRYNQSLPKRVKVISGLMEEDCSALLHRFFKTLRNV